MEATYYDYINALYELLKVNPPSSNAQLLYHTLLMEYNRACWQSVELHRTNSYISGLCGLGDKALANARNELKQYGLIDFQTPKKRATIYRLLLVKSNGQEKVNGKSKESQKQANGKSKGVHINKKEKEEESINNNPLTPFDGELGEAVELWLAYKKEKRSPYKPIGLAALYKKIHEAVDDIGEAGVISAINRSIENGWQGLFFEHEKKQNHTDDNYFLKVARGEIEI